MKIQVVVNGVVRSTRTIASSAWDDSTLQSAKRLALTMAMDHDELRPSEALRCTLRLLDDAGKAINA